MNDNKISDKEFIEIVKNAKNTRQALVKLNLEPKGANYLIFKNKCERLNIKLPKTYSREQACLRRNIDERVVIQLCKEKFSKKSILEALGLTYPTGSNMRWIDHIVTKYNVDTTHWTGQAHLKGKSHNWSKSIPLEEVLVEGRATNSCKLKERLIKQSVLENKCFICEIDSWCEKPLSLHLDHRNGNRNDNRLENLRLLCPNCHSQTDTYCGKNKGKY